LASTTISATPIFGKALPDRDPVAARQMIFLPTLQLKSGRGGSKSDSLRRSQASCRLIARGQIADFPSSDLPLSSVVLPHEIRALHPKSSTDSS